MPSLRNLCLFAIPILLCTSLYAQTPVVQHSAEESATTVDDGPAGIVPARKGFNLSLGTTSQHDSSNGWSSLLTPNLAYRFNPHFSVDAGAPIYDYINILKTGGTKLRPTYTSVTRHFAAGDTTLNGHMQFDPDFLSYELTATVGFPSGDTASGLGAGQVTYSFVNHFDKSFGIFTPLVELGIGDSSSLEQTRVRKSYVAVGTMAHFQAGTSVDLPYRTSFSASAYEELPLAAQTIFSTTGRGKKKVTTATTKSVGEDNGFETSLDIPLNPHVTLSGFYNRSLRSHIDTAGFSFTFLLKAPPRNVVR